MLLLPVHSIHRCFIKIVALLAPDFVEHLLPFLGRIDFGAHASQVEAPVAYFFLAVRLGVDDAVAVVGRFVNKFRTIGGEGETIHIGDEHFVFAFF